MDSGRGENDRRWEGGERLVVETKESGRGFWICFGLFHVRSSNDTRLCADDGGDSAGDHGAEDAEGVVGVGVGGSGGRELLRRGLGLGGG